MLALFSLPEYPKKPQMFSRYLDQRKGNYLCYAFQEAGEFVWVDPSPAVLHLFMFPMGVFWLIKLYIICYLNNC